MATDEYITLVSLSAVEYKVCRLCQGSFPATTDFFHRRGDNALRSECKQCACDLKRIHYEVHGDDQKNQKKEHYRLNIDFYRAKSKAWRNNNKAYVRSKNVAYYKINKDKLNAENLLWRNSHKKHTYEYQKEWRKKNPGKNRLYHLKRKMRQRSLPYDFTLDDWLYALNYWKHSCAICGKENGFWQRLAADHWIPLSAAHCPGTVPWNIVPLCDGIDACNSQKHNTLPSIWLLKKLGKGRAQRKQREIERYLEDRKRARHCIVE